MRFLALLLVLAFGVAGCTKVVTTPIRAVGSAVSIVPVAGGVVDGALDATADTIDLAPF